MLAIVINVIVPAATTPVPERTPARAEPAADPSLPLPSAWTPPRHHVRATCALAAYCRT